MGLWNHRNRIRCCRRWRRKTGRRASRCRFADGVRRGFATGARAGDSDGASGGVRGMPRIVELDCERAESAERRFELVAAAAPMAASMTTAERVVHAKKRVWQPWAAAAAACLAIVSVVAVRYEMRKSEQVAVAPGASKLEAVNTPPPAEVTPAPAPVPGAAMEQAQNQVRQLKDKLNRKRAAPRSFSQQQREPWRNRRRCRMRQWTP